MDGEAIQFTKEALWLVLLLSGPPIAAAAVVALVVAIVQAVTQIQEQTIQHLLKFVAVAVTLFITAPLLGGALYHFADRLLLGFPDWVR
jgi:type III secretion HrpO family protein